MADVDFKILTVLRSLGDGDGSRTAGDGDDADSANGHGGGPVLVEGLLFPELCVLEAREMRARATLRDALERVIARLPPMELGRRGMGEAPDLREVTVELPPPEKSAAWSEPLWLRFHTVQWRHGEDVYVAFVPALGIEVAATTREALDKLIPEHVRFALRREKIAASMHRLALLDRVRDVRLGTIELRTTVKDPKQAAQQRERAAEADEKPLIDTVGAVLTAAGTVIPPAFEADALVAQLADALGGRNARSVLLVGPSGVGKTAAVRQFVRTRDQFDGLAHTSVWSTSGSRLVAGMSGFGLWQQRVGRLVKEATKASAVLHVGSLIELMEVGRGTMVGQGIASFLRPYVGRGDVRLIAECTPEELPVIEQADPHLLAVFRQIAVEEPPRDVARRILRSVADVKLRRGEPVEVSDAALDALDRLHRRYAGYSAYPGRPLRFLQNLMRDRADAVASWATAGDVTTLRTPPGPVGTEQVTAAFARETGLPRFMLDDAEALDLATSRAWFAQRVVAQPDAVDLVVDVLATVKAALNRPRRPVASLLFIGPTGVGKTEMAKTLAEFFFADRTRVSRFDMSEYASPAAVARLVGGAGGDGNCRPSEGLLTAKVREQPFSVILLDEFEKADASLFDLMLQVLGEGRLTDAAGRVADFSNAIVIMTSNLGAETFQRGRFGLSSRGTSNSGDDGGNTADGEARRHFVESVRDFFRPELFNRIDRVVPFAPLGREAIAAVTRRELELVARRDGVKLRGVALDVADAVVDRLAARGFDARYGARPLKRAIERELLVPLAEAINTYPEQAKLIAGVSVDSNENLAVHVRPVVDAAGRLASATASGATSAELATRATRLRRGVQRIDRSAAVLAVRNEVERLEQSERRDLVRARRRRALDVRRGLAARGTPHVPHDPVRAARLKRLADVTGRLATVSARAVAIEDDLLHAIYDGRERPADEDALAGELQRLEQHSDALPLAIYALRFDEPDKITLALYGEHARPLLHLARAYVDLARLLDGTTELSWFARVEKGSKVEFPRTVERDAVSFTDGRPAADLAGVVIALRFPHALLRLADEAGLHLVKDGGGDATCLVQLVDRPLDRYEVPAQAGTRKWIETDAPTRTYDLKNRTLDDATAGPFPFIERPLEAALLEALDKALRESVQAALDG